MNNNGNNRFKRLFASALAMALLLFILQGPGDDTAPAQDDIDVLLSN